MAMAANPQHPAKPCGFRRSRRRSVAFHTAPLAVALLALAGPAALAANAAVDAAANAAIVAPSHQPLPTMLGYQEGARRRARCATTSSNSPASTTNPPYLQGLDLHFLPAMGGGGGAYSDPFLAGVSARCSSGLARVEYDPPGLPPGKDARVVFGQDLRARADAARAAEASGAAFGGGAVVKAALCPPGQGVVGVGWRPARPSGDAKEEGQPLRVGGVTLYCRAVGEGEEEEVAVVVDPAPEASAPPPHTQRPRLACGGGGEKKKPGPAVIVSELDMWHDDVFNGFSVAACV